MHNWDRAISMFIIINKRKNIQLFLIVRAVSFLFIFKITNKSPKISNYKFKHSYFF